MSDRLRVSVMLLGILAGSAVPPLHAQCFTCRSGIGALSADCQFGVSGGSTCRLNYGGFFNQWVIRCTTEGQCASARLQTRGQSFALASTWTTSRKLVILRAVDAPREPTPCEERVIALHVVDRARRASRSGTRA